MSNSQADDYKKCCYLCPFLVVLSAFNSILANPLPAPTNSNHDGISDGKISIDGFSYIAQVRLQTAGNIKII